MIRTFLIVRPSRTVTNMRRNPTTARLPLPMNKSDAFFDFLKEKGLYQNTLIVLSGDHGESLAEHGEKTHGFFIYNATMHVPLIIRLPPRCDARDGVAIRSRSSI